MESIIANTQPPSYKGEPVTMPEVRRHLQEYAQNPTYSDNLNQYTDPRSYELTRKSEVRDSHYFWNRYKDKLAPDTLDNSKAYMVSFGKIQGIQNFQLRDFLLDRAIRSGVYTQVLLEEIEEATTERIATALEGMKEETKADHELLEKGNFEEYHQKQFGQYVQNWPDCSERDY